MTDLGPYFKLLVDCQQSIMRPLESIGELPATLRQSGGFAIAAYDHAVQAGSSVDCFKHLVLILMLQHMVRDGDPFLVIDTHAGRGRGALSQKDFHDGMQGQLGWTPSPVLARRL